MQDNQLPEAAVPVFDAQATGESAGDVLKRLGTDAQAWADEFMKIHMMVTGAVVPQLEDIRGWLISWFANAIEAGAIRGESLGWRRSARRHGCDSDDCMLFDMHTSDVLTREEIEAFSDQAHRWANGALSMLANNGHSTPEDRERALSQLADWFRAAIDTGRDHPRPGFDRDTSLAFTHWLEFHMSAANRNNDGYLTLSRLVAEMRSAHAFGVYPWHVQGSAFSNAPKEA